MPADVAAARDRRRQAVALRLAGASYEAIAVELRYGNRQNARRAVLQALSEHEADDVKQMRALEGATLDRAQRALWPAIIAGDAEAIRTLIRLMAHRARLFGLYAPTRIEVSEDVNAEIGNIATALVAGEVDGVFTITDMDGDGDG